MRHVRIAPHGNGVTAASPLIVLRSSSLRCAARSEKGSDDDGPSAPSAVAAGRPPRGALLAQSLSSPATNGRKTYAGKSSNMWNGSCGGPSGCGAALPPSVAGEGSMTPTPAARR